MSLFGFGGCKCSASESADPAKDTIKFSVEDKENMSPQTKDEEAAAAVAKAARERERAEAEARYQRELEEERTRAEEQQRQLEEAARLQREAEDRREAEERAQKARMAVEEAEAQRQAAEAEEERLREVEARHEREAREAREAQEFTERKKTVARFLKRHGYDSVNTKRKSKFGRYKFALHTAVKHNPEIVPLLLEMGAEPSNKNSKGQTPYEYAKQLKSSAESMLRSTPQDHTK